MTAKTTADALQVELTLPDGRTMTIKRYFLELLASLWNDGEGFSSKRPLGDGDWRGTLYCELAQNGFINCKFDDDDGGLVDVDPGAHDYVESLIFEAFNITYPTQPDN